LAFNCPERAACDALKSFDLARNGQLERRIARRSARDRYLAMHQRVSVSIFQIQQGKSDDRGPRQDFELASRDRVFHFGTAQEQ
jgi:hypothetical protein